MEINETDCCAVMELSELRQHTTAEAAMANFCDQVLPTKCEDYYCTEQGHLWCRVGDLGNLYTFTGVVKDTSSKSKPVYGPRFKAFILKHHLGTVTESRGRPNILNHKTHIVKIWTWSVNRRNLKAWWRRYQKER